VCIFKTFDTWRGTVVYILGFYTSDRISAKMVISRKSLTAMVKFQGKIL